MASAATTASTDDREETYTRTAGLPAPLLSDQDLATWKKRIAQAKTDRRRFEPNWRLSLAFAAGKHWLEWVPQARGGRFILPRLGPGEYRYTVDKITDLRMTVLGQFSIDGDDRPQLLFRGDDILDEDFAHTANKAVAAGWDTEWMGDRVLADIKRAIIDLGTAPARCRFDPTAGPKRVGDVPHRDGAPILDPEQARKYVAEQTENGGSADLRAIHEGRIRWDAGTPFNVLVPAGIKREDKFPWEVWVEPVHIDKLFEQYGSVAQGIKAEAIDDVYSLGEGETPASSGSEFDSDPGGPVKLQDHAFLYTVYEKPTRKHPDGREIVFAGANLRPLEVRDKLRYVGPDGTRRSGIHYFHYVRLTDRFWSRSLIDLVREGQKAYNKARSQVRESIDRSQPYLIAEEGAKFQRRGTIMEIVRVPRGTAPPTPVAGAVVGDAMWKEIEQLDEDMRDASGLQDVLQGDNPQNVGNYSQLALLQEQASRKFDAIFGDFRNGVVELVEDSVYDIRRYWGADKQLGLVVGGELDAFKFDATKIPDFYRVYAPHGNAMPRSQAAELKKVDDLATYGINSGQPLPLSWVAESYEAGKPVALPEQDRHDQLDKALLENQQLEQAQAVPVAYYDDHALHVTVHRSLQAQVDASGNREVSAATEQHIQEHLAAAQKAAAAQAAGLPAAPDDLQAAATGGGADIPHPSAFSLFLRQGDRGPGNFGI